MRLPTRDWSTRSMKLWSRKRDFSRGHATGSAESPPQSPIKSFENDMETYRWLLSEEAALLQFWSPTGYRSTFRVDDEVPRDQGSCVVGFSSLRERWCVEMDTEGHFPVRWECCGSAKRTINLKSINSQFLLVLTLTVCIFLRKSCRKTRSSLSLTLIRRYWTGGKRGIELLLGRSFIIGKVVSSLADWK